MYHIDSIFTAMGHLRVLSILLLWPSLFLSFGACMHPFLVDLYLGVKSLVVRLLYVCFERALPVVVSCDCCNIAPRECICSPFWCLKSSRSKCWLIWFLLRALSEDLQIVTFSVCLPTAGRAKMSELSGVSSWRDTNPIGSGLYPEDLI